MSGESSGATIAAKAEEASECHSRAADTATSRANETTAGISSHFGSSTVDRANEHMSGGSMNPEGGQASGGDTYRERRAPDGQRAANSGDRERQAAAAAAERQQADRADSAAEQTTASMRLAEQLRRQSTEAERRSRAVESSSQPREARARGSFSARRRRRTPIST